MQRYTKFFITVNALHLSGGFSAYHQELKNCTHSIGCVSSLLAATASVEKNFFFFFFLLLLRLFPSSSSSSSGGFSAHHQELQLTHASGSSKQAWHIPDAVCTVFELLMMGGETA
jgi:hypothetical protein